MAKKKVSRKKAPAAKSNGSLGGLSTHELHAELARRQRSLTSLERKRDRLAAQLDAVHAEIAALGGAMRGGAAGGVRRRPRNEMSLVEALGQVLDGRELGVTEAAEAVVSETGYQTTAENFRTIVNQTLLKNTKQFKKVSRGVYTAK